MQTIPPIDNAVTKYGSAAVHPKARKQRHVISSVATVMPEMGFDDEPTSPVSRDETVTNKNPKMIMRSAPRMFIFKDGTSEITIIRSKMPAMTHFIEMSWSVRGRLPDESMLLPLRSARPDLSPCQMVGIDRARLISPPATTAPAPM